MAGLLAFFQGAFVDDDATETEATLSPEQITQADAAAKALAVSVALHVPARPSTNAILERGRAKVAALLADNVNQDVPTPTTAELSQLELDIDRILGRYWRTSPLPAGYRDPQQPVT